MLVAHLPVRCMLSCFGRLSLTYFAGLGVGASSLIIPVYISESSPPAIRGRLIGIFEILLQFSQIPGWVLGQVVR